MRFSELCNRLPQVDERPDVVSPQAALTTSAGPLKGYVEPTFDRVDWQEDAGVLLIEAAGAVGKSVAAEALAARLRWPLVRAEKAHVGSYSLSGLIQDAFGFGSDYIARIAHGEAGVVVDSLDEAHLRAGTQNFLAFLENVRNVSGPRQVVAGSPERAPSIILLSRSDTAELVRLYFADADMPLATARLSFFDKQGADSFIECYLRARYSETNKPEYNVTLASPRPFARLRDERYRQVMRILLNEEADATREWGRVSEFLGYAPVLIALAESLAVTNPAAERSALALARSTNENDLLNDIVVRILERERIKVRDNLYAKLEASLPASSNMQILPDEIYTPLEQAVRIVERVLGVAIASPLPATLPPGLRDLYEQSVKNFLADHPFTKGTDFASVVFGDYIKAFAVGDLAATASLSGGLDQHLNGVGHSS